MKAVLISIRPKWCEKIFNGQKTIEVRKSRPKIYMPFKCYIYETKAQFIKSVKGACTSYGYGRGKVIGEFVCDEIIEDKRGENADVFSKYALLSLDEQKKYGGNKLLYGWHITEPKLFDEPLELKHFIKGCDDMLDPQYGSYCGYCPHPCNITRPPQSWCYVEGL